jgi:hypothetical protein
MAAVGMRLWFEKTGGLCADENSAGLDYRRYGSSIAYVDAENVLAVSCYDCVVNC